MWARNQRPCRWQISDFKLRIDVVIQFVARRPALSNQLFRSKVNFGWSIGQASCLSVSAVQLVFFELGNQDASDGLEIARRVAIPIYLKPTD
jgi:hypothetical protein